MIRMSSPAKQGEDIFLCYNRYMRINIEFNNEAESPIAEDFLSRVAQRTIELSGCAFLYDKDIVLSVAAVSEDEIKDLNRIYRKNDNVTDILSFCEFESRDEIEKDTEKEIFLGELILCYNDIEKYARENGIILEKEIANVFSHGVLHLLGFSHGEEMFAIQKKIIDKI